ncbi:molybdopterin molybdotransferase MoeA [Paracraurococcus lichenis]|uniref:Molybdopterin molybdenumtransferase n=1 Tax=Paracraurococcus lichenis TaxID=3064888 RepID=A0ABT9E3W4_9PROT|nr:gephyrin-like molybdotransferase Glp [Paracraurococcus sp. LOR1-02]MDO9710802.1 molybdopterin molybdotransferase MoeA [Paracraurococcus sp. LOR1-02]
MPDGTLIHTPIHAPLACCDEEPGLLPVAEARARLLHGALPVAGEEVLAPTAALGRLLAAAPRSARSLPPFDQSAMDGYALHAADLAAGATDLAAGAAPLVLRRIAAGDPPGPAIGPGEAVRVLTGAPVPPGAAAVVMEEHVALREGRVEPRRPPRPGTNIRRRGEDLAEGDLLLAPGTRLDARHLALLAAADIDQVAVRRRVRVALLSNGNELGAAIRDSNRPMLAALLARPEIALTDLGVLPDDPAALAAALAEAARGHDLILASGGISGSDADHLPGALRAAGGEVEVLKLAQKPGKPLAHGRLGAARCLFLPGNPLAALVGFLTLGRPLLARLAGAAEGAGPAPVAALAARGFARKPGREEFLPARVIGQDASGLPLVEPAGLFGSARLVPLAAADGLLWVPADIAQVRPGDALRFHPFAAGFGLA